jgi:type II secretory ATPase GspE/PulE/Tfp pilus assembly ATPase PilB-like protein
MGPHQEKVLEGLLHKRQGVLLFCGTDSDDLTANLHACAKKLATPERHLMAVETYREEWSPGIEQLVSYGDAAHFAQLLRLAFRHAPDVLLVNPLESRDDFELCLNEALKGRLVLCRSFAADAADAVVRLLGMGVEPYLIGSSLMGVVAQRAVRLNCPLCQEKESTSREQLKDLGIPVAMQPPAFYHGKGCANCLMTGFDRETNLFEILEMSDDLRHQLHPAMKSEVVRAMVRSNGMMTLRQAAVHKAINGQTSLSEVLRTTP